MAEEELAHYAFLPWVRQGISSQIDELENKGASPTGGMAKERAELEVEIRIGSNDTSGAERDNETVTKTLKVLGPPDIAAIQTKAIVRTEPKARVNNFEANGLAYIEFYQEEFLWAYTPARASYGSGEGESDDDVGRLTPWLALICLKDDEFTLTENSDGLSTIAIPEGNIADVFHDQETHWAWGHVHLNTEMQATNYDDQVEEFDDELAEDPDTGLCRLVCPRKLVKETNYTAFLIPAFETGRLAALGEDYTDEYAQEMSWSNNDSTPGDYYTSRTRGFEFPVYYQWNFATGEHGDFETLAALLEPVVIEDDLGKRDMDITDPGYGLDAYDIESTTIGLEGALKPPAFESDEWPVAGTPDEDYQDHMRKLLNLSIDHENQDEDNINNDSFSEHIFYSSDLGEDPIVTPHIYGRWHALASRLDPDAGENFDWVDDLNLDPRNRAAAGLGTKVIQDGQEEYMERSWQQVESINEANAKIKAATLSKMVNNAMYHKHIRISDEDQAISLTTPMHKSVVSNSLSIHANINESLVPNASKSGTFKRITRPGKKSNKTLNAKAEDGNSLIHKEVINNFNTKTTVAANAKMEPSNAVATSEVVSVVDASVADFEANDEAMAQQAVFDVLLLQDSYDGLDAGPKKTEMINAIGDITEYTLSATSISLAEALINSISSSTEGEEGDTHVVEVGDSEFDAIFDPTTTAKSYSGIIITKVLEEGAASVTKTATSLLDLRSYQTAFVGFNTDLIATLDPIPYSLLEPVAVDTISLDITAKLTPKTTVVSRAMSQISVFDSSSGEYVSLAEDEPLQPLMAYPVIDDAMYTNLKEMSQEYILPNLDKVPENSITLMETNQQFIESYMAGLNHEMSRELLWREFPTDQRGSYFRQFWDVSDNIQAADQEELYDIKEMHTWEGTLGAHYNGADDDDDGSAYLVLLIRGDLLKKYPNTLVYAQKAKFKDDTAPDTPRELEAEADDTIKTPVFQAQLDPDIYLFGFDLDTAEAKGDSSDASQPGWFFVLRERPGQIRFGLDDNVQDLALSDSISDWNDLYWEHFATTEELENYQLHTDNPFSSEPSEGEWGKNAADMAYILFQNPVLYARHAQEMLPDEGI